MDDLISRQAAIDAILHITNCKSVRELFEYNQEHHLTEMWSGGVNDAIDAVIGVESATDNNVGNELGTNLASLGTDCISRQAAIDRATKEHDFFRGAVTVSDKARRDELLNVMCWLGELPPVQPETAKRIVGKSRDGMTLWYQCDMCNEPVDAQDNYCRGCGRRLIDE